MKLLLLLLTLAWPMQAEPYIRITWQDSATIRVEWSGVGNVCAFVNDVPSGVCGFAGGKPIPFAVAAGQVVTLRRDNQILASAVIPDTPYPVSAVWVDRVLHITIANSSPNRCLFLVGGGKLDTFLPGSCGVGEYDLPSTGIDSNYATAGRVLRLVELGAIVYDLPVPPFSVVWLPDVERP